MTAMLSRLFRRQPKARSWADATPQEIAEARIQELEEAVQHLASCVTEALEQCVPFRGDMRPHEVFSEEWSK